MCDHSNESYRAVLSCGSLLRCTRWFEILSVWMKPSCMTIQMKAIGQYSSSVYVPTATLLIYLAEKTTDFCHICLFPCP